MFTEQSLSPQPFGKLKKETHDEHLKLYSGYVKNANTVLEKIAQYQGDEGRTYELGELYRHFAFEFNGMRNHECYFRLLEGKSAPAANSLLAAAIAAQWESLDAFKAAYAALAGNTRGIGWAMLSWDPVPQKLIMHWIDEQHLGQLQGTVPIIALDLWEHSYVADYQPSGKKQYVTDFIEALNWTQAEANFAGARRSA